MVQELGVAGARAFPLLQFDVPRPQRRALRRDLHHARGLRQGEPARNM